MCDKINELGCFLGRQLEILMKNKQAKVNSSCDIDSRELPYGKAKCYGCVKTKRLDQNCSYKMSSIEKPQNAHVAFLEHQQRIDGEISSNI